MTSATAIAERAARGNGGVVARRRIVLDCRWLGMGGAGRLTELLLSDFAREPPPGDWVLWGRPGRIEQLAFDRAEIQPSFHDPRLLLGQRDALAVPRADIAVYMHQIRPLRPGPSVTFILDTIPLRHGGTRATRRAKRAFFRAAARASTRIVTISEFSKACIVRDLGVPPGRITVVHLPMDTERAAAIADQRRNGTRDPVLLYIGRFAPHKNLRRLAAAFADSRFARAGGRLVLVGGWPGETEDLRAWLDANGLGRIEPRPACSEEELCRLMVACRAVVVPSLEEGYGLPAFEAAAAGIPVAASMTGAMNELPRDVAVLFDPLDVSAIRDAIDEATSRSDGPPYEQPDSDYAAHVVEAVTSAVVEASRSRGGAP